MFSSLIYRAENDRALGQRAVIDIKNLIIVTFEYSLFHETEGRPERQWPDIADSLIASLKELRTVSAEEKEIRERMANDVSVIKEIFSSLSSLPKKFGGRYEKAAAAELDIMAQILARLDNVQADVSLLNRTIAKRQEAALHRAFGIMMFFIITLLGLGGYNEFMLKKAMELPIKKLLAAMSIVAKGNLEHKTGISSDDEIGEIAAEFDQMTEKLKDVTASREELTREIEERKKAEELLRASEERYRRLFETTPDGVFLLDSATKLIFQANPAASGMLGYRPEEFAGKKLNDIGIFINEEELQKVFSKLHQEGYVRYDSMQIETKDKGPIIADVMLVNRSDIIQCNVRDVTERKKSEEFIKDILQSVDEGFVVIDADYKIIAANRAYLKQEKMNIEEVISRHCYEVSHHIGKPCFMEGEECAPMHTFKTGEPYTAVHIHYDKENNRIYIEEKSFPMKDMSGKIFAVIETLNDITERRKLEEQLRHAQKMGAIGTLAGGIAHDFNNTLSVIIGYGGLMEMTMKPDDPKMSQLKQILAAADRAAQLTKGLLAFSRKQVMEIRTVNLNEIIEGFKKMLTRIIGEDIDLKITLSGTDLTVKADIGQIEQVLMNLATNARDAMPKGGVLTIETKPFKIDWEFIKAHGFGEPGMYALITVTDTGIGMDEKIRDRIFEPYFTTKELGRGTGLGLAIVYGIVTQHKGYVRYYSEPGKGTTFRIYIPLVKEAGVGIEKEEDIIPKGGDETILIAEDDSVVRCVIKDILEGYGYRVIEAVDGEDAVRKFRDNKDTIRLLISDLVMPKKNGKDAYEEIKAIRHDIKVIFMSGCARDIIQRFGIEEGIEFISKPVLPNELLRKVREELDKKVNSE